MPPTSLFSIRTSCVTKRRTRTKPPQARRIPPPTIISTSSHVVNVFRSHLFMRPPAPHRRPPTTVRARSPAGTIWAMSELENCNVEVVVVVGRRPVEGGEGDGVVAGPDVRKHDVRRDERLVAGRLVRPGLRLPLRR